MPVENTVWSNKLWLHFNPNILFLKIQLQRLCNQTKTPYGKDTTLYTKNIETYFVRFFF